MALPFDYDCQATCLTLAMGPATKMVYQALLICALTDELEHMTKEVFCLNKAGERPTSFTGNLTRNQIFDPLRDVKEPAP
jgi:hypothetical protein